MGNDGACGFGENDMESKELARLIIATPLALAATFYCVFTAVKMPSVATQIQVEKVHAESDLALVKYKLEVAKEQKQAAFTEFDICREKVENSYKTHWEQACLRLNRGADCLLEKEGPSLNMNFKQQKEECKQRFDMRMAP